MVVIHFFVRAAEFWLQSTQPLSVASNLLPRTLNKNLTKNLEPTATLKRLYHR